jgi:hypothetical protein
MRRAWLIALLLLGCNSQPRPEVAMTPTIITRAADLDSAVGKLVTLEGTVEASRIATLLGVDVESESPDLRGKPGTATGRLERQVITQAEIDREIAERGQFAHRGPGTFFRLVDPKTGQLVQVQRPR